MNRSKAEYRVLGRIGRMMAADAGLIIAESAGLVLLVPLFLLNNDFSFGSGTFSTILDILWWMFVIARLAVQIIIIVSLTSITSVQKRFGTARTWHLLHTLVFAVYIVIYILSDKMDFLTSRKTSPVPPLILFFGVLLGAVIHPLFLAISNGQILRATSDLMYLQGYENEADEIRNRGQWLVGYAAVFTSLIGISIVLIYTVMHDEVNGLPQAFTAGDLPTANVILCGAVGSVALVTYIGYLLCWIHSSLFLLRINKEMCNN